MLSHDPSDQDRTTDAPTPAPAPGGDATRRTWGLVMAAGVVAGVGSWLAGEAVLQAYGSSLRPPMKPVPTMEDARLLLAARVDSGTLAFGAMGGLLGLALGLAGGLARRSARSAASAGAAGLLLGAAGVGGVARVMLPILYTKIDPQADDLMYPLLGHMAIWSVAGVAGGLAFGLGAGGRARWWKTAFGGLVGAALATVVYEFAGALGFATHQAHLPMAGSSATRAMAQVLVAIGTAIGSVMATAPPKGKPASP